MIRTLRLSLALVFAVLTLVTVSPQKAEATDLTIPEIYLAPTMLLKQPIPVEFLLRNQNILMAITYSYRVRIWRKGVLTPVYDQTGEGANLTPFTDTVVKMTTPWNPTEAGDYEVEAQVMFSEDIDLTNNSRRQDVTLVEKPNADIKIQQLIYFGPARDSNTTHGVVSMSIPTTTTVKFLNVLVRHPDSAESKWLVRNIMILPSDRTEELPLHTWIDFHQVGYKDGDIVDSAGICVSITDVPLTEPPAPGPTCEMIQVTPDAYTVGPGIVDSLIKDGPSVFTYDEVPAFVGTLPVVEDSIERGCTVPNLDLDSSTYGNHTDPNYAGDWNACAPTGAANSIQWMENSNPAIKTNLTLREKLKELSAMMNRPPGGATASLEDMIKGKLAFIDKYKLPIRVKYQSWWDSIPIASPSGSGHTALSHNPIGKLNPTWDWYVKEMKDSEDVEVAVVWYDSLWHGKGGHVLVATGAHTIHGVHRMRMKDDYHQDRVGGERQTVATWDTIPGGGVYLPELSRYNRWCMLRGLVSESYDTTVKHEPDGGVDPAHRIPLRLSARISPERLVSITFTPDAEARYWIRIVDIHGRTVTRLAEDELISSERIFNWNAKNASAGVYFIVADGLGRTGMTKVIVE